MKRKPDDPGDKQMLFKGMCIDLLLELQSILKFNYTLTVVEDGNYGSLNETTQEWNGLVEELVQGVGVLKWQNCCDNLTITVYI